MKLVKIILVLALVALVSSQPQRQRQTPLSMGLKMLGDLRDSMTKRIQGLFGGNTQTKPQQRPPQGLNIPPPPPPRQPPHQQSSFAPNSPSHQSRPENFGILPPVVQNHGGGPSAGSGGPGPQSSFFAVHHEPTVSEPVDSFSGTRDTGNFRGSPSDTGNFQQSSAGNFQGPSDLGSFGPPKDIFRGPSDSFGPSPFQGTIEEDNLTSQPISQGPLPLEDNALPLDSFPPHGSGPLESSGLSSTAFTSFGGRSPPESDTQIPFGNTASFTLGAFRQEPAPHSILRPDEEQEFRSQQRDVQTQQQFQTQQHQTQQHPQFQTQQHAQFQTQQHAQFQTQQHARSDSQTQKHARSDSQTQQHERSDSRQKAQQYERSDSPQQQAQQYERSDSPQQAQQHERYDSPQQAQQYERSDSPQQNEPSQIDSSDYSIQVKSDQLIQSDQYSKSDQSHEPSITLLQSPKSEPQVTHPQVTLLSNSPSPTHKPFTVGRHKENKEGKSRGGVVNTGIKMKVISTNNEDGTRGSKVSGYEFGYGVLDKPSGNQFFHAEKKDEDQTKGSYKIQLPDGRVQTVTYVANNDGFHPRITYDGYAQYPVSSTTNTP